MIIDSVGLRGTSRIESLSSKPFFLRQGCAVIDRYALRNSFDGRLQYSLRNKNEGLAVIIVETFARVARHMISDLGRRKVVGERSRWGVPLRRLFSFGTMKSRGLRGRTVAMLKILRRRELQDRNLPLCQIYTMKHDRLESIVAAATAGRRLMNSTGHSDIVARLWPLLPTHG